MLRSIVFPVWPQQPFDPRWHSARRGVWAERAVARHLWLAGWRVEAHRWRASTTSDIDLVAANDEQLLFAEVKLRTAGEADPWAEVYDPQRIDRLRLAIGEYLRATRQPFVHFRVDAFLVRPNPTAPRTPLIEQRENYLNQETVPGWRGKVVGE